MSQRISDTLKKTWDALIDKRLNVLILAIALFVMTFLTIFVIATLTIDGLTAASIVAIFAAVTGLLLFVMKNIHDRKEEVRKKDELALFLLSY